VSFWKLWRSLQHLLEVVEEEQKMPISQCNLHLLEKRVLSDLSDSQLLSDGWNHQPGVADRGQ
jgi:hypothetical protein